MDLKWQSERLVSARITSSLGTDFRVAYERYIVSLRLAVGES